MAKDKTSKILSDIAENELQEKTNIGRIKRNLHERGFGVLMAIFCLPLILPIPAPPGYTTLFSIPLFILSVQMIWGAESPWLPKWITKIEVKTTTLRKLTGKAIPLLKWIEKFLHPRLSFAAFGILVMSLGLLGKDGVVIIIGKIIGIIGLMITSVILYGIYFGSTKLMETIPEHIRPHVQETYGPVIEEYKDYDSQR